MTENHYVIDSCSLIDLKYRNPMDIYKKPWNKLEELITKDRLLAPEEVLNEISKKDDDLYEWGRQQKGLFVKPNARQIQIVSDILKNYAHLIKLSKEYVADPWLIALAIDRSKQTNLEGEVISWIVVTEEKLSGNKMKIPLVCRDYGIRTLSIMDMFREEGWEF